MDQYDPDFDYQVLLHILQEEEEQADYTWYIDVCLMLDQDSRN